MNQHLPDSRYAAWRLAVSLALMTVGSGAMYVIAVVLPAVQAEFGVARADASLPYTLMMVGFGIGGIAMGRLADRHGVMVPVLVGAAGLGCGFVAAGFAPNIGTFALVHGVLLGLCGSSATFAPLVADTSLWWVRRRGTAVAICASGNYIAGALWPPIVQHFIEASGWRATYIGLGIFCAVTMPPLALCLRARPPGQQQVETAGGASSAAAGPVAEEARARSSGMQAPGHAAAPAPMSSGAAQAPVSSAAQAPVSSAVQAPVSSAMQAPVSSAVQAPVSSALQATASSMRHAPGHPGASSAGRPFGLAPGLAQAALCVAGTACCVAMSMPQVHIVAYCADLGYGPARGAQMLSLMLACGIVSRLVSGVICDRIGGLRTLLLGSGLQGVALLLFLPFDGLASLYAISALFGLFQGGIVPSYAIIVREHFPPAEAGARVGTVLTFTLFGMALGGWLSGAVFDLTGSYRAAFLNGIAWNLLNLTVALWLFRRARGMPGWGRRAGTMAT